MVEGVHLLRQQHKKPTQKGENQLIQYAKEYEFHNMSSRELVVRVKALLERQKFLQKEQDRLKEANNDLLHVQQTTLENMLAREYGRRETKPVPIDEQRRVLQNKAVLETMKKNVEELAEIERELAAANHAAKKRSGQKILGRPAAEA